MLTDFLFYCKIFLGFDCKFMKKGKIYMQSKQSEKRILSIAAILTLIFLLALCGCTNREDLPNYIENNEAFLKAIQNGDGVIYVGDILFASPTEIVLNYPVQIIGKPEKSLLENVRFTLKGTNVPSKTTDFSFRNIILDGKQEKKDIPFEEGKTFDEIVGDLPQYHAVDGSIGYLTLTVDNCEIKNFLHENGPALYVNNDANFRNGKKTLHLLGTKIYNNVSYSGTVKVFSDVLTTYIDRCDFYANTARAGQGISVGNGLSYITNTDIHDNDFFHFVYYMERRLPAVFHDDKKTFKGITANALGGSCGALFIGGSHTTVDTCKIYNNQTVYGGGIGIINAETLEQDEKIEIKNTEIVNNVAVRCGGGVYIESNQGETTYFTNCTLLGNKAGEEGGVLYTTTYAPDNDQSYGGNVQFTFCTMANNVAADADAFTFYELLKPELAGKITLKGCFVLDNSPYLSAETDYTYVASKEQALAENVITETSFAKLSTDGIRPVSGSKADISVPSAVYQTWTNIDTNEKVRAIGFISPVESTEEFPYWTLVFPALAIDVLVFLLVYFKKKKAKKPILSAASEVVATQKFDYSSYSFEEIAEKIGSLYDDVLTKKEIVVATYLLYEKSRKEIAQELILSEETVKTHLSHIFKKTDVSSKNEFKEKTEKLLSDLPARK